MDGAGFQTTLYVVADIVDGRNIFWLPYRLLGGGLFAENRYVCPILSSFPY